MKKLLLLICIFPVFISCTTMTWEGEVRFEVEGTISDVDIYFGNSSRSFQTLSSVSLPWGSGELSAKAEEDNSDNSYIKVTNNTDDTSPITVSIFVDGKLRAQETKSDANCVIEIGYTIDEYEDTK